MKNKLNLILSISFGLIVLLGIEGLVSMGNAFKFEEYTAMTIISTQHQEIKSSIVNDFDKAISVYRGERDYL